LSCTYLAHHELESVIVVTINHSNACLCDCLSCICCCGSCAGTMLTACDLQKLNLYSCCTCVIPDWTPVCVCVSCREMWAFANNDDIRAAIHAEPISKIGRFDECSDRITYTHDTGSMIPIHADLVSKGMRDCMAASQDLQ